MALVSLINETWQVLVDPEEGVGVLAGLVNQAGQWLPVMPDTRQKEIGLNCASFLMIPYSNRIEQGRFQFAGRSHQLANGEHHAIHGDVRQRPWSVLTAAADVVRCAFDSSALADFNWPWTIEAQVEYRLIGPVFSSKVQITNRSETAMPVGMGWHPYFSRSLRVTNEEVGLCFKVAGAYPDANNNRIPSGPPIPVPTNADFSAEKALQADNFLDACFSGYDGQGYIHWPESGVKLHFVCSDECSHLVIYNPAGRPFFAVEPVTNANNGVNLYDQGEPSSGVAVLEPGGEFTAQFDLQVELV